MNFLRYLFNLWNFFIYETVITCQRKNYSPAEGPSILIEKVKFSGHNAWQGGNTMKKIILSLVALAMVVTFGACDRWTAQTGNATFSATITKIEDGNLQVTPDPGTEEAKASDSISVSTPETVKYLDADGNAVDRSQLSAGQRVSIVYDGRVAESFPVQIRGAEIRVLSDAVQATSTQVLIHFKKDAKNYYYDKDQKILMLIYSSLTPQVQVQGREEVASAINDQLNALNENFSGKLEKYLDQARDEFEWREAAKQSLGDWSFSHERMISVTRGDSQVISFVYDDSDYTGGAHGYTERSGVSFDLNSGKRLTLSDLTTDVDALQKFSINYIQKLSQSKEYSQGTIFQPGYEKSIHNLIADPWWYFSDRGLVFVANPYELASYAAGRIEFTIPYEDLKGVIDEKWIPGQETSSQDAQMEIAFADGRQVLDTITIDEGGQSYVLTAKGTLRNVRLSEVAYNETDGTFTETATLWFASMMSPNQSVNVISIIPEGAPTLQISYTAADGSVVKERISQSGKDGSLMLVSPEKQ